MSPCLKNDFILIKKLNFGTMRDNRNSTILDLQGSMDPRSKNEVVRDV